MKKTNMKIKILILNIFVVLGMKKVILSNLLCVYRGKYTYTHIYPIDMYTYLCIYLYISITYLCIYTRVCVCSYVYLIP